MSQTIYPGIRYRDAEVALAWLKEALGAAEHVVYRNDTGAIRHAELVVNGQMIMFGQWDPNGVLGGEPPQPLSSTIGLYVVEPEPDAHYARAKAAGATIVRELEDTDYGSREYSLRDVEGNLWSFGTYDPATVTVTPHS